MLKKLCIDHPMDWDRFVPAVLFAYREIPNDSLKFSPFELLYGRQIRGPLTILHELWTNDKIESETKTTYQYVVDLSRLEETAKLVVSEAEISSKRYKAYFNLKTKPRKLNVDDEGLVLLPSCANKLTMQWLGLYKVVECRCNGVDYVVKVKGKCKLYHINMLKKYVRREVESSKKPGNIVQICIVQDVDEKVNSCEPRYYEHHESSNFNICNELDTKQKSEITNLLSEFPDVLCDQSGLTSAIKHFINLNSNMPVHRKPYAVPRKLIDDFNKEVDKMLEDGIIEPFNSIFCSPVVMLKKSDNSWRLCIDFRALNSMTDFDTEPMSNTEEVLGDFVGDKYFTEIDLCKGYWQIPLAKDSKLYTAFAINRGLMQFTVLPFWLSTACATFVKLMRKVVFGLKNTACYFDIVIHNDNRVDQ